MKSSNVSSYTKSHIANYRTDPRITKCCCAIIEKSPSSIADKKVFLDRRSISTINTKKQTAFQILMLNLTDEDINKAFLNAISSGQKNRVEIVLKNFFIDSYHLNLGLMESEENLEITSLIEDKISETENKKSIGESFLSAVRMSDPVLVRVMLGCSIPNCYLRQGLIIGKGNKEIVFLIEKTILTNEENLGWAFLLAISMRMDSLVEDLLERCPISNDYLNLGLVVGKENENILLLIQRRLIQKSEPDFEVV